MADQLLLRDQLFDACKTGHQEDFDQLLADTHIAATILKSEQVQIADLRPRRDLVLYQSQTNLHRMLVFACEAQDPHKVESLLRFGLQHDVTAETMLTRDLVGAAMETDINVALFEKFVAIMPGVVNLNMSLAGDPLAYAVGGHFREAQSLPHKGTVGLAQFLLEHGAEPNRVVFPQFNTPGYYLFVACRRADLQIVQLLLQHGAQIEGSGAIQIAAAKSRIDVLESLLQHGADLNSCFTNPGTIGGDYTGSAMEVATKYNSCDAVLWLAEHGAQ